jgi:hypothetical protein
LANDATLDWVVAFLESLREQEPDIPMTFIPFDKKVGRLTRVAHRFGASVEWNPFLEDLDQLGGLVCESVKRRHMFRKFAAFAGRYEYFLYLDSDVIVLNPLRPLFDAYVGSGADFLGADTDINQVYRPGRLREYMLRDQRSRGFNAGCFLSVRGRLTIDMMSELASSASEVKEQFVAHNGDQPFFNYCIDSLGLVGLRLHEVMPELAEWTWANAGSVRQVGRHVLTTGPGWGGEGKRIPFLHWAGFKVGPSMPNAPIFLKYRLRSEPWTRRLEFFARIWWYPRWRAWLQRHSPLAFRRALRTLQRSLR